MFKTEDNLHIFVVQTHTLRVRQLTDLQHPHYTSRYQLSTLHSHLLHRLEPLVVSLELVGEAGGLRGELARHVPDAGGELARGQK